jgi:uncharacterized protein YndB with AHSA1/START domain
MSVAPIVASVVIKAAPQRAFELFTQEMGRWWPKGIGKAPFVEIVLEPYKGGRWYERDVEGVETQWGAVLAWEPPRRLLLAWQINSRWSFDAEFTTEVEVTFSPADGGTHVTLEHRQLERYGSDFERHSEMLRGGWPTILGKFAAFTNQHEL